MREYSQSLALLQNSRGVYTLDPSIGCTSGTRASAKGCYNECYAAKSAKLYGYDFRKTVFRDFDNEAHLKQTVREIFRIPMPFIRMGTSGDPSENWRHTLDIIGQLVLCNKEIVIITKHWTKLSDSELLELKRYRVCINTSVSALDTPDILQNGIEQYQRIKPYCKSILRVVSCNFNTENETGARLAVVQDELFKNYRPIDTVFRVSRGNDLVKSGVINSRQTMFLGKKTNVSKYNSKTYFGKCGTCKEMCGVSMEAV